MKKIMEFLIMVVFLFYLIELTPVLFVLLMIAYSADMFKQYLEERKKIKALEKKVDTK